MQPLADQGPCPSSKLWFAFRLSDYDTGSDDDDGDDGGTDTLGVMMMMVMMVVLTPCTDQ